MLRRCAVMRKPLTVPELVAKVKVRQALASTPHRILNKTQFAEICIANGMNAQQANEYLTAMHRARAVLYLDDQDVIHMKPEASLEYIHESLGIEKSTANTAMKSNEPSAPDPFKSPIVSNAALYRKRFWSAAALFSAVQMCGLSYLTFIQFDWDVMEPACYFVTTGTALLFYLYFIVFRKENNLSAVDANVIPRALEKQAIMKSIDGKKWMVQLKEELNKKNDDDSSK